MSPNHEPPLQDPEGSESPRASTSRQSDQAATEPDGRERASRPRRDVLRGALWAGTAGLGGFVAASIEGAPVAPVPDPHPSATGFAHVLTTVAAVDTPSLLRVNADYVCTGQGDLATVQQALDANARNASGPQEVLLLAGTYRDTSGFTVSVGAQDDDGQDIAQVLRFQQGAHLVVSGYAGRRATIKLEGSASQVINANIIGDPSGTTGTGIAIGGDASTFGGRRDAVVYQALIAYPTVRRMQAGIDFTTIDGQGSTGDCMCIGGLIHDCNTGIRASGFTNRLLGPTIDSCTTGIWVEARRLEAQLTCYGATINNWKQYGIRVDGGIGTSFHDTWLEHTVQWSTPAAAAIRVGEPGTQPAGLRFAGSTTVRLLDESFGLLLSGSRGLRIDEIMLSTTGKMPRVSLVRNDMPASSGDNLISRVTLGPNPVPVVTTYSESSTAAGAVFIGATPGPAGAAAFSSVSSGGELTNCSPLVYGIRAVAHTSNVLTEDLRFQVHLHRGLYSLSGMLFFAPSGALGVKVALTVDDHTSVTWAFAAAPPVTVSASVISASGEQPPQPVLVTWPDGTAGIALPIHGNVSASARRGLLKLSWSQDDTSRGSCTMLQGSWLRAEPLGPADGAS